MVLSCLFISEDLETSIAVSDGEVPRLRLPILEYRFVDVRVVEVRVLLVAAKNVMQVVVLVLEADSFVVALCHLPPLRLLND